MARKVNKKKKTSEDSLSQLLLEGVQGLFRELGRGRGKYFRKQVFSEGIMALHNLDAQGRSSARSQVEQLQDAYEIGHPTSEAQFERACIDSIIMEEPERSKRRCELRRAVLSSPAIGQRARKRLLALLDVIESAGRPPEARRTEHPGADV
jgi:hypothetical protein